MEDKLECFSERLVLVLVFLLVPVLVLVLVLVIVLGLETNWPTTTDNSHVNLSCKLLKLFQKWNFTMFVVRVRGYLRTQNRVIHSNLFRTPLPQVCVCVGDLKLANANGFWRSRPVFPLLCKSSNKFGNMLFLKMVLAAIFDLMNEIPLGKDESWSRVWPYSALLVFYLDRNRY